MIAELFHIFWEAGTSRKEERLNIYPFAFRDDILEAGWDAKLVKRIVADMIGGMGDQEVVRLHQRLTGTSLGSALDYVR
jgi:dGTP triphosphohydrolase